MARVRIPDPVSFEFVQRWFLSLLRGFFSGFAGAPLSAKTNTFKFLFDLETVEEEALFGYAMHCKFLFIHSLIHSFVRLFVRSLVRSFVRSFVLSFFRSFVLSFFRSFVLSFFRSFVRSFIHSSEFIINLNIIINSVANYSSSSAA